MDSSNQRHRYAQPKKYVRTDLSSVSMHDSLLPGLQHNASQTIYQAVQDTSDQPTPASP